MTGKNIENIKASVSEWSIQNKYKHTAIKTIFGLKEFVDLVKFQLSDGTFHIVKISDLINDKYLQIKVKVIRQIEI